MSRLRPGFMVALLVLVALFAGVAVFARGYLGGTPPTPHVPSGVVDPKVGVHTRLADEVEPGKIARSLDMTADMGASWIVELFPWAYHESEQGSYQFAHADMVVDAALQRHLKVIARLDIVPQWARPPNSSSRFLAPERYADYATYVGAFSKHFRGKVPYIVIWNEPNLSFEWGFQKPSPQQYVQLLRLSYRAAKEANSDVQVVTAGMDPTTENSPNAMDDLAYLKGMYDAGASRYFDVLGAHAYGLTRPANETPATGVVNFQRVVLERQVMIQRGDAAKPVLITETGWNDAPRWTHAVRPAERVRYTIQAYRLAATWPWLLAINFFEFRLPVHEGNVNDFYAFVQPDFTPRALFRAVQQYAHGEPVSGVDT